MASYFTDEFEEFRARALSGGNLPSIHQLQEQAAAEGATTTASSSTSGLGVHSLSPRSSKSLNTLCTGASATPGTPPPWAGTPSLVTSGRRQGLVGGTGSRSVDHGIPAARRLQGMPTVVLSDEDTGSEADTETTTLFDGSDVIGDNGTGNGIKQHGSTSVDSSLAGTPQRSHNTKRCSADTGSSNDAVTGSTDAPQPPITLPPPSSSASCRLSPGDSGERVLSHMSWIMLDEDEWSLGDMRPRVSSMPAASLQPRSPLHGPKTPPSPLAATPRTTPQHKVRSFAISRKGVVSRGDVFVTGSSHNSVASNDSGESQSNASGGGPDLGPTFRVMVSGEAGVGKRALVTSFMSPEMDPIAMASFGEYQLVFS